MTKVELDDIKPSRGTPYCALKLEAITLREPFPQLLYAVTLHGVKPPYNSLILSYKPVRPYCSQHSSEGI